MRRFRDSEDQEWEAVVGRESWGGFWAIFVPRGHDGVIRQAMLGAESHEKAADELEALDLDGLRRLLATSRPKDPAGP